MRMFSVLQLICLVFLSGSQAKTLGADVEGSSYAQVDEILLGAQVEQLRKENLNLIEKIQIQDKQLKNIQTLEIINKNLTQENIENMKRIGQLTKTIEDLHNATMQEIKSASLCQCIPEAPEASELELTSIQWSCPLDKVMIKNGSQIENSISLPCSISNCSMEDSSWPQCEDILEKGWTPWVYVSCQMHQPDTDYLEPIMCGSGHRSRSREMRSSSANPWRNETVTEQCQHCNVNFGSNYQGEKITVTPTRQGRKYTVIPLALGNALNNSMHISVPIHSDVLEKIWTPWVYHDCQMDPFGPGRTILCGLGSRSRSREVRESLDHPWKREYVSEECVDCEKLFD